MNDQRNQQDLSFGSYTTPYYDAVNAGIVPEWAYQIDVHETKTYTGNSIDTAYVEFTLPSVAQQWKDDMKRKVRNVRRRFPATYPILRAPESFIDTGIWPDDVARPNGGDR